MLLFGVALMIAPYDAPTGDLDFVFYFALCCNSGILPLPLSSAAVLVFYTAWVAYSGTNVWLALLVVAVLNIYSQAFLERYARHRFGISMLTNDSLARTTALLHQMLPKAITHRMLAAEGPLGAQKFCAAYEDVCIMYCDISGFTKMSAVLSPTEVIAMLNRLFAAFEAAAIRNGVFKVQTIGDCFVAVAGLPFVDEHPTAAPLGSGGGSAAAQEAVAALSAGGRGSGGGTLSSPFKQRPPPPGTHSGSSSGGAPPGQGQGASPSGGGGGGSGEVGLLGEWPCLSSEARVLLHPREFNTAAMVRLAMEMCLIMRSMPAPREDVQLGVRIGLHTGGCIGGVIGSKAFRYDVFGKDVLAANTMEASGCPGGVLLSSTAADALRALQAGASPIEGLQFLYRGKVFCEGIGSLDTHFVGAPGLPFTDKVAAFARECAEGGGGGGH